MELMNTPQAVNTYGGKSQRQATRIANRLSKEGYPYPQKVGRDWIAPAEVWKYVLGHLEEYPDVPVYNLMNTREAGEKNGKSADWAKDLAKRQRKLGKQWPHRIGREWVAPEEIWKELFENTGEKGRLRKKE